MTHPIGLVEFYIGCMGTGFLYVAGALLATGCHFGGHHETGAHSSHAHSFENGGSHANHGGHAHHGTAISGGHNIHNHHGFIDANHGAHANAHGHVQTPHHSGQHIDGSSSHPGHGDGHNSHQAPHASQHGSAHEPGSAHRLNQQLIAEPRDSHLSSMMHKRAEGEDSHRWYFLLMRIINPMSLATFVFFFGAAGLLILKQLPWLMVPSWQPASIIAVLASLQMQNLMSWVVATLDTCGSSALEDAIGAIGEVSVSIPCGRTGEVVFLLGQTKRNYPARCAPSVKSDLKRRTRVVITDIEQNIVFVERYDDWLTQE